MDNRDTAIKVGDIFIDIEKECYDIKHVAGDLIGIPYVLAQVDWDSVALLNIFNGNRYSDPVGVKDINNISFNEQGRIFGNRVMIWRKCSKQTFIENMSNCLKVEY